MTVESSARKQSFAGGQATLTYSFKVLPAHPSNVKVTATSGGVDTILDYGVDYTVTQETDGVGGTVTLSPTYSTAYTHTVYRDTDQLQESDYDDYNQFPADTLEEDIDHRALVEQEISEALDRSLKLPISTTASSLSLPSPNAGKALKWRADETGLENTSEDIDVYLTAAANYASTASTQAGLAAGSATAAATSATLAANYAITASTGLAEIVNYTSTASTAATAAATSATQALASQNAAATSSTLAGNYVTTASTYATAAATSATLSGNYATTSGTQAALAGNYASTASTQAIAAATSATLSGNYATSASASAVLAGLYAATASSNAIPSIAGNENKMLVVSSGSASMVWLPTGGGTTIATDAEAVAVTATTVAVNPYQVKLIAQSAGSIAIPPQNLAGLIIPNRTDDPANPSMGTIWLRTDL